MLVGLSIRSSQSHVVHNLDTSAELGTNGDHTVFVFSLIPIFRLSLQKNESYIFSWTLRGQLCFPQKYQTRQWRRLQVCCSYIKMHS